MANRVVVQYSGDNVVGSGHRIAISTPAKVGARLILAISAYNSFTGVATNGVAWTLDDSMTAFNHVRIYSRISDGTETSLDITGITDSRVHAVLYEREDCAERLFSAPGQGTNVTSISATATVPANASGRVFSALNSSSGSSLSSVTYNQGLVSSYTTIGTSSSSAFATGAMPAPGSRTWTVSNVPTSTSASPFLIVGYGSTDSQAPSVPGNLRATSVTGTVASIAWDASSDNVAVTGYGFYKDGVKQGSDQTALTASLTGLTPGQTYLVQVDAVDAAGNRSAKASLSVTPDGTPPTVPGNLRLTAAGLTQVSVAWDPASDNVGVTGYGLYVDGTKQGADQEGLGRTLSNLLPGHTYLVEVDATDAIGNRSPKASLTVETQADVEPPAVPANLRVVSGGPYGFTVQWDPASDNVGVTGYGVHLGGQKLGNDQAGTSYTFASLTPQSTYQVAVDAADSSGNRSALAQLTHVTPADVPPSSPPNLRVTALSYTGWTVEWDPAADDVQVVGYDVAVDGQTVAVSTTVRSLSRSGLPDDTPYVVRVWAVDHIGQRSTTPAELVVRTLNDFNPTPPALTVTAGEDSLTVAWTESSDDFAVAGYEVIVDQATVHTTPGVDYTVGGLLTRRHTVTGLTPGATYDVRVAAVDSIGQRSADNTQQVTTAGLPYVPVSTPVYRLGAWAGNVLDQHLVTWTVKSPEGWASSAPVSPVSTGRGGVDGGWDGAGRHGPRRIVLKGTAVADSNLAMLAAKQRLLRAIHPRDKAWLRVSDARMTRQVRVRLDGQIRITDDGPLAFEWELPLKVADPRRYAIVPVSATAVIGTLPGEASAVIELSGTYANIPARLRLFGPIRGWTITHEETGTVMRGMPGDASRLPADPRYSFTFDLASRQVLAHVPPTVWLGPRPGRSALAHLPAWFHLIPGVNTITLAGEPVAGEVGTPRLVVEAYDAWS
ncbi:fibronectin type III domain-containing protein [Nonomuraea basaltis]|uniref:fibronectin type III domain-containing protein n=1 Tax=Nonomuraea basaltis TaxID=2495887 RepID=UPI0014875469|nr:fibronectin type III domain-containing protein [Nonomuraea basaltis]